MRFADLREDWQKDRAWARSVPEVPEDHVEVPRKGTMRFDGNHGAWMAPLAMIALLFCLFATLSTPIYEPMTLIEMNIKQEVSGGSGTLQTLKVGLWGFCLNGPDGDCSKVRGLFSSFGKVTADLPEHLQPLSSALTDIPQSFLNAVGVFPIFVNAYIYAGALYAFGSATLFERKERRTLRWQQAAVACFHWVIIWISIAFGLMIGFYQKVKTNVAKTELNDFVSCKIGVSIWLLLTALLLTLWIEVTWQVWRFNAKRGIWQPAAWMMYIGDAPADVERPQSSIEAVAENASGTVVVSKEEEAVHKKSLDGTSDTTEEYDLPCYTATASAEETVVSSREPQDGSPSNQKLDEAAKALQKSEQPKVTATAAPTS